MHLFELAAPLAGDKDVCFSSSFYLSSGFYLSSIWHIACWAARRPLATLCALWPHLRKHSRISMWVPDRPTRELGSQ